MVYFCYQIHQFVSRIFCSLESFKKPSLIVNNNILFCSQIHGHVLKIEYPGTQIEYTETVFILSDFKIFFLRSYLTRYILIKDNIMSLKKPESQFGPVTCTTVQISVLLRTYGRSKNLEVSLKETYLYKQCEPGVIEVRDKWPESCCSAVSATNIYGDLFYLHLQRQFID